MDGQLQQKGKVEIKTGMTHKQIWDKDIFFFLDKISKLLCTYAQSSGQIYLLKELLELSHAMVYADYALIDIQLDYEFTDKTNEKKFKQSIENSKKIVNKGQVSDSDKKNSFQWFQTKDQIEIIECELNSFFVSVYGLMFPVKISRLQQLKNDIKDYLQYLCYIGEVVKQAGKIDDYHNLMRSFFLNYFNDNETFLWFEQLVIQFATGGDTSSNSNGAAATGAATTGAATTSAAATGAATTTNATDTGAAPSATTNTVSGGAQKKLGFIESFLQQQLKTTNNKKYGGQNQTQPQTQPQTQTQTQTQAKDILEVLISYLKILQVNRNNQ
ncbi:hypothetical protein TTHERM_01284810 (macronuclear) [Tetrahymena thermophila SB210]|uniref:Uncharacterized protein n=1 Tax=Tetrahymena thermophila (strain SB210) TaxID=312017 RepID=Q24HR4_TETTS|nr:hypothetical protein TTHERM_01284810 [Tetrahymena thermophila SB210]EAS07331.2 hypothetical protein TTHERM_01284810 [Tetrahymena thermophila SB210]|eukprot:XP_001027573.2 hypothetical protein TTHERM_01284810 [Tetrahymena thermophila SB210]